MRKRVSPLSLIVVGPKAAWDFRPRQGGAAPRAPTGQSQAPPKTAIPGCDATVPGMGIPVCEYCESIDEALVAGTKPDLIVLLCARRGQFTAHDIERLQRSYPPARIAALLGPCCEGALRHPCDQLPGAIHVPWHAWDVWARIHIPLLGSVQRHEVRRLLSPSATAEELAELWARQPVPRRTGRVVIDAADRDNAAAVADLLRPAGYAAAWCPRGKAPRVRGAAAVVCDSQRIDAAAAARIRQLAEHFSPAPVLVLVNFPRSEEIAAALAAGAHGVLRKPFTMGEILGQLELALDAASAAATSKEITAA